MRSCFALPAASLLCVLAAVAAKPPAARIDVHVTAKDGSPIEHAEVEIKSLKGEKASTKWKAPTDQNGMAKAPPDSQVPQGEILVEVTASGYEPYSEKFQVNTPEQTIEVKVTSVLTRINVHVTTPGGKPVDRADVVVKFVKGRSIVQLGRKLRTSWEMRTNQEGLAKVPEIPRGTILIQVIAKGYQTFGQTFDVDEAEKTIEVKLNPPQEQYSAH